MTRTIGIVSGKGGVGKTFVAINLAVAMEKYCGKDTLIVDCNLSTPHVGLYLGVYSTPVTLNDVLKAKTSAKQSIYMHPCGVSFLPASLKLNDLKNLNINKIKQRVENIFSNYDYVFVDAAPGFGLEGLIPVYLCKETIFVTTPIIHSACDLIKCKQVFSENGLENLGIVLNMVKKKPWELSSSDVRELVGYDVISRIPYDDKVTKYILMKKPVVDTRSKAAKALRDLAYHLEGIPQERGLLQRLFGIFKEEPLQHRHPKAVEEERPEEVAIEVEEETEKRTEPEKETEIAAQALKSKIEDQERKTVAEEEEDYMDFEKDMKKTEKEIVSERQIEITKVAEEDEDYIDLERLLKQKLKERMEAAV